MRLEAAYPWVVAALLAFAFALRFWDAPLPDQLSNLFSSTIDLSAISVGFLATIKSILVSMDEKRAVAQLKETKYWDVFIDYIMSAITASFALAASSLTAILCEPTKHKGHVGDLVATLWMFCLIAASLSGYRVFSLFARMLKMRETRVR